MANFNKIIVAGYLCRDVELRYLPSGKAVCQIGVAVNRTWTNEAGEEKSEPTFIDVDVFGKTAEVISQYLKKGSPILFEGRLRTSKWNDKVTNQPRQKLGVVLESFQFLGSNSNQDGESSPASAPPRPARGPGVVKAGSGAGAPAGGPVDPPYDPDDVPFTSMPPAWARWAIIGHGGNKMR